MYKYITILSTIVIALSTAISQKRVRKRQVNQDHQTVVGSCEGEMNYHGSPSRSDSRVSRFLDSLSLLRVSAQSDFNLRHLVNMIRGDSGLLKFAEELSLCPVSIVSSLSNMGSELQTISKCLKKSLCLNVQIPLHLGDGLHDTCRRSGVDLQRLIEKLCSCERNPPLTLVVSCLSVEINGRILNGPLEVLSQMPPHTKISVISLSLVLVISVTNINIAQTTHGYGRFRFNPDEDDNCLSPEELRETLEQALGHETYGQSIMMDLVEEALSEVGASLTPDIIHPNLFLSVPGGF